MLYVQYAIIALVFIFAIVFMIKKFMPTKDKNGNCSSGCGSCGFAEKPKN